MRDLQEDQDEFSDWDDATRLKNWIGRQRRHYGIKPNEATCWFVEMHQMITVRGRTIHDLDMKFMASSPSDALSYAECFDVYRRIGFGRWVVDPGGEEEAATEMIVRPHVDEGYEP